MRVLFLGFLISPADFEKLRTLDPHAGFAAQKLQSNIVRGLEEASGQAIDLLSSYPISTFPDARAILVPGYPWQHVPSANDHIMPHLNVIVAKHISRFLSSTYNVLRWSWRNHEHAERVTVVYALHSPHVLAAVVQKVLAGNRLVVIVPDLPQYMNVSRTQSLIRALAKSIDRSLLMKLLSSSDGVVVLTEHMIDVLGCPKHTMVMEGMVSDSVDDVSCTESTRIHGDSEVRTVMYAGILARAYGVGLLLDAFALLEDPNLSLLLFGNGEMAEEIRTRAREDSRIDFRGLVSNAEVLRHESESTVLINVRSAADPYTAYSFPSKILEYMSSGTPVISTRLSGIPNEYFEYLLALDDESPEGLAVLLRSVCSLPRSELDTIGRAGQHFVRENKSWRVQGRKLFEFLNATCEQLPDESSGESNRYVSD